VTAGKSVHITHNTLANNPKVAIMMSDSDVTIENNTCRTTASASSRS